MMMLASFRLFQFTFRQTGVFCPNQNRLCRRPGCFHSGGFIGWPGTFRNSRRRLLEFCPVSCQDEGMIAARMKERQRENGKNNASNLRNIGICSNDHVPTDQPTTTRKELAKIAGTFGLPADNFKLRGWPGGRWPWLVGGSQSHEVLQIGLFGFLK